MRNEIKCCCGATAAFHTHTNGTGEAWDVRSAYERWMSQHTGCPALYAKPTAVQTEEPLPAVGILHYDPMTNAFLAWLDSRPAGYTEASGGRVNPGGSWFDAFHAGAQWMQGCHSQVPKQDRFTEYERNLLGSCSNWLRSRSNTVWAEEFQHSGLMMEYHVGINRLLAGLTLAPPDLENAQRHGSVGPEA